MCHCPHSPAADATAMDRYLLLAGPTAANLQQRLSGSRPMQGQTDGRTDTATLRRPCAAYCVRSVSKYIVIYKRPRWSAATQQNAEHITRPSHPPRSRSSTPSHSSQSCPWAGLGRDFSVFGGLGWVGSTPGKVLKF